MHCPNVNSPEWKSLVERVGEVNAWREFFKYGAIPSEKQAQVLQSIRTKTTEEIADILGNDLVRSDENIKYTNFIQALVLNKMGDLTPGKKMEVSPEKAFSEAKKNFETAVSKIQDFLSIVKDEAMFNGLKERDAAKLATQLESRGLTGVTKYGDVLKALSRFKYVVDNFDELKENVKFSLAHKGIQIRKNKLEAVDPVDVTNQQEDETEDNAGIPNEEINPQKFDASVFETNFRNTASLKVRGLIQTIRTGEHELGIPLYANPEDVMSDILYAGAAMKLSGYTDKMGKYKAFITALELRSQARPYLSDLIWKIDGGEGPNKNVKSFKNKGEWHTINQILTFATKAFANENILLYQLRRQGTKIVRVSNVKTIGTNQETVDALISKYWLAQHKDSSFFTKTVTGELYPVPEKVNELDRIRKEGKALSGEKQVAKFIEYFKVLGIELTKEDMDYITPNLSKKIKRGSSFSLVFADNQMLDNIYKSFESMQKTAFKDDYGFQNEKKSMKALAGLYYDANPGRFDVVSARTADGKSKYLYIQPSYAEILKREWNNASDDTGVSNTALARPNRDFWKQVKLGNYKFNLGYFNGSREQQAGKDGKVRKNFTQKEQQVAMFLKHQENLNVGSYILFTLSDKTTTIETKMTKEFFVDNKNQPMGKGLYFNIGEDGKTLEYTDFLKKKLYNSFVEPEVSRILSAMKAQNVNLENFDTASKLFYIIPAINSDGRLNQFREDLYKGEKSIERLNAEYGSLIGDVVLQEFLRSSEDSLEDLKNNGIIEVTEQGDYAYPLFKSGGPTDYLNRVRFVFNNTKVDQKSRALLMLMDMKLNYMNAQVKSIQFLKFDPMVAYKKAKDVSKKAFNQYSGEEKIKLANSTWDEFSKRAAALIAPGSQGSWSWISKGKEYDSTTYKAVTVADVNDVVVGEFKDFDTTDAQEFVTLQEHIDYLMSEGKISIDTWNSIHEKIVNAGKGGYYTLTDEEVNEIFNPVKPVHVGNAKEGAPEDGLYRVDYIKTSRYPLLPQHEKGSERDKLRIWMENNDIQAVNFASGKKLGRPELSVSLFDKNGNFVEPSVEDLDKASQVLSRDGLRNQQEIPHQKDEIATVSQMNRTLFDQLLDSTFTFSNMKDVTGREGKALKEAVRSRMFEQKAEELRKKIGDLTTSHRGLYNLLRETILNDTTGSYTKNDLDAIQLDKNGFFKMSLETHFKAKKMQGLINSMVNKNVMLKVEGTSFIQVSGVGAKFNYSSLSKGAKSDIIWTDTYAKKFKKDGEAKLEYIRKNDKGEIQPAQVLVSQYLRDSKGNLINLNDYITEKDGVKILDTSKFTPEMFQLVASRIPNQSHVSMLPIEVVGFLPSYMENSIVVPDGITAQMGSDFDVDKLFAYTSTIREQEGKDGVKTYRPVEYSVSSINDVDGLSKEQLTQLYRDIHWNVLTHPDTFGKITKSVDNPEVKKKVEVRNALLDKYGIVIDKGANLPLDFNTSIQRFVDNKSGKNGVSIFANLISAQADLQDKPLRLGKMVDKQPVTDPVQIRLSKSSKRIIDLVNVGETGTSTSFLNKKRSISDNLNIMFTESVDNAKNQFLKEFGWTEKSMGAVGLLSMLTDDNGQAVPIEFSMDLTSQPAIQKMLEKIDQKQDSFGKFDSDAILNSIVEIQSDIEKYLDKHKLTPTGLKAAEYLSPQNEKRDSILDPETLSEMWVVGKALDETDVEKRDATLEKLAKDFGYKSKDALMLKYFEVQYDSLNLFNRLQDLGRELMTILGSVYTYTKGIGPNVFATKQKMEQLNKLSNSFNFLGIENLAGLIEKKGNQLEITPQGEIGYSIKNSLIFAQNLYNNIFPISVGSTLESLVEKILDNRGLNKKDLSKNRYESTYSDVFNGVKNYLFTMPDLGLFTNVRETRNTLINGDTSIGKRVIDLLKQPEFSKNGFLKNIDIDVQPNGVYVISFRAPFGTEIDESLVMSGFYQLATSKKEEIRQLAKDFALYPFATGDAGSIGRFIPVNYYLSDKDFRDSIKDIDKAFVRTMSSAGKLNEVVDQIVQNNSEEYAQKFSFGSTVSSSATYETPFKQVIKPLLKGAENLASVKKLKFTIGDFEAMDNTKGLVNALKVPLTEAEINFIQKNVDPTFDPYEVSAEEGKPGSVKSKYPSYILITDSLSVNLEEGKSEEDRNVNYLYKRVSSIIHPVAEYERINILGYKNIKEYSFDNANLKSVIKGNDVDAEDSIFLPDPEDQVVEKEIPTSKNDIYSQLGNKTKSENVVIKPWAELKDASEAITPEGIVATRIKNSEEHFGNPYSHDPAGKAQGLIKTETIKEAVEKYIDWVINSQDSRAKWIREQLQSGELKSKPILYYKELGEPSHATALDYLINKYDWNNKTVDKNELQKQNIKEGVKELFDSNPELANAVYEALGFEIPTTKLQGKKFDYGEPTFFDVVTELTSGERSKLPSSILINKLLDGEFLPTIKDSQIILGLSEAGMWRPNLKKIEASGENKSSLAKKIGHELLHSVTNNIILSYQNLKGVIDFNDKYNKDFIKQGYIKPVNLTKSQVEALDNLVRIRNKVVAYVEQNKDKIQKKDRGFGTYDYFIRTNYTESETDLHEFISEVFTNPELINILKEIPSEGKKSNLFKDFVDAIAKILGFTNTSILEDVIAYSEEAFFAQPQITPQQKQQTQQKFQEYIDATGKQDIKGFKEFINKNILQVVDKNQIYSQLGNKTASNNVVIKSWGELKDATKAITPQGIISTRIPNTNEHFGNPFSHDPAGKTQGLIKTETIKEAVEKYIDWVINSFNLEKKNLFTVTPRQTVDKKAIIKASIATQYIGFGEGINNSSTELYRQQAGKYANTGNYSYKDTIFVSIGGKRGTEQQQKEQQDRTIKEVLKAIETGATIITDNKAYIDSSSYNTGEKRLYSNLEAKGYKYSEKTIDGQLLGVWNKEGNRAEWVREQLKSGILKGKPIVYYKELGEPSHATALDYLINKYDWGKEISTKETKKVEKVEISSNAKGLAGALTNPTELSKSKGNIAQSYPVEYKGTTYKDAEAAYQALKDTSEAKTKPGIAESNNYRLMVNIIEAKLTQHPRLVSEITKMGGVEWISDATHQPTSKNTVWETGGQNWFIKSLAEAYQNVLNKESQANVEDTTLAEVKHETLEYKGTDFIHEGNIEEGTLAFYYQNKESGKGALVTDPNLNNKLSVAYEVKTRPQDVVQLTELQHSPKYLVSFEGQVLSLNPSSYGDEIQSPDIIRRVLEKYNTKLEDKVVEEAKGAKPGEEKPTFSYKGITVNTEFQLSKEQETALTTLIDFVSNPADDSGPYGASFTLEGYAGTGKTSIIGVLEKYISQKQKHTDFVYMAPTHAATVSLGLNVVKYGSKDLPMTVQSATATDFRTGQIKFSKKFTDRVKGINAVVVLDEASMLANKDFDKIILAARSKGYKIIFMGDPKQIPEVDNAEAKAIAKAFSNPNITKLSQVFRTKDVNILTVLTNIRNNKDFKEQIFESTENLKQVSRSEYNNLLINDLQNDLENTTIINYTNNGVFKANLSARKVLNFSGELQVGEKIVGYLGSQTKQIEKGHLANSVPYIVKDINKSNKGPVQITCTSQLLKNLTALGMKGFPEGSSFTYLQLSKTADSLDFNLTPEQLFFNKQEITKYLRPIHELNLQYKNKQISYPAYTEKLYELRSKMSDINLGNKYIYNPTTDDVELYDRNKHKGINANLELDKGVDFGYAITIHKSQGMTIPNVYFDVNSLSGLSKISIMRDGELFNTEKNALYYVGMSRASNKLVVPLDVSNEVPDSDPFSPGMAQGEEYINLDDLLGANDNTSVTDKVVKETFGDKSAPVTAKEILNKVYATSSPLYRQLLKLVAETGGVGGLKFVVDETLENPGEYNVGSKIITINPKLAVGEDIREGDETLAKERLHEVIMHEVMHHVTAYMINADPSSLSLEQRKWVTALKGLFSSTKEKILKDPKHRDALLKAIQEVSADNASLSKKDKSMYYGLTNVHDFVSMLMTDEGFREFMNNTTFEGDKSIFDRFLDILANILKALGIEIKENSVLKEGIGDIVGLIKSREQSNREVSEDVFKSVKTSSKFEYVKDNLSNIVESLNIVKTC